MRHILLILLLLFYTPADAMMLISGSPPAGGGTCANATVTPTSDGATTNWTLSAGVDHYALIDDGRAGDSETTYTYNQQDSNPIIDEIVFDISTPGDCNISAINVYALCKTATAGSDFSVYIKADAGAYSSADVITCPLTTQAEQTSVFTSLSYTTPQSITVKIENDASTFNWATLDALTIEITP